MSLMDGMLAGFGHFQEADEMSIREVRDELSMRKREAEGLVRSGPAGDFVQGYRCGHRDAYGYALDLLGSAIHKQEVGSADHHEDDAAAYIERVFGPAPRGAEMCFAKHPSSAGVREAAMERRIRADVLKELQEIVMSARVKLVFGEGDEVG